MLMKFAFFSAAVMTGVVGCSLTPYSASVEGPGEAKKAHHMIEAATPNQRFIQSRSMGRAVPTVVDIRQNSDIAIIADSVQHVWWDARNVSTEPMVVAQAKPKVTHQANLMSKPFSDVKEDAITVKPDAPENVVNQEGEATEQPQASVSSEKLFCQDEDIPDKPCGEVAMCETSGGIRPCDEKYSCTPSKLGVVCKEQKS